jgi:methionyl-tRNA formyltransferase
VRASQVKRTIVIATPHPRNDELERRVSDRLRGYRVLRFRGREELTVQALEAADPRFVFFPHWSWIIPASIYERFECVVFHMTDLPYGRGGSPLQNLLVRGHKDTMLTALRCIRELDAGPVYAKRPLSLAGTAEEILTRASNLMEDMIVSIVEDGVEPVPQEGTVVAFKRRAPEEGSIGDLGSLSEVFTYIRMLDADGYPRAFLETPHLRLEFDKAVEADDCVEARVRFRRKADG